MRVRWSEIFLGSRFYYGLLGAIALFLVAIVDEVFLLFGIGALILLMVLTTLDMYLLWGKREGLSGTRITPLRFSNGDENPVRIELESNYSFWCNLRVIDEVPVQFQRRDLQWALTLKPNAVKTLEYHLKPSVRGEYHFGLVRVFASTNLGLISRRYSLGEPAMVKVYPSFLRLKEYAFMAFDPRLQMSGMKRMRRLGHTMEFEHIKEYVPGDDTRALNWKATARTGKAMVNQYQDERAQPIYCMIDKGRLMQMPFDGMTLLDYSINASLVMSYVAIHKGDKAGLLTFSDKVDTIVEPGRRKNQMHRISEALYNQQTIFPEADFERLYATIARTIHGRSLVLLMTNFSSAESFARQLPYLKSIAGRHVLVVIFFRNSGLDELIHSKARTVRGIYHKAIAEKMQYEQTIIVGMLRKRGIHAILTTPQGLTVDLINKYIALKAQGTI